MEATNTQVLFFQHIKNILLPHISLVDDIADRLNISSDSAFRRIRGEKPISMEELGKLAKHYHLSLDKFLHLENESFIFNGHIPDESDTYEQWLETDVTHLEHIHSFPERRFYILAKEIPFLYYFYIPEIAAFKSYFFKKSIIHYDQMRGIKFSFDDDYNHILSLAKKIAFFYSRIPSTEIWHEENITSTLRQIEFYKITGNIRSNSHVSLILDKLDELINHLELQAELGKKFLCGSTPQTEVSFTMYMNEIINNDNMIYVETGKSSITYINHSLLNFITTRDETFNAYIKKTLGVLAGKSTQISNANERDRMIFFNKMRDKINVTRKSLLA